MNEFDIPIFKKIYELYKEFYVCLQNFPRQHKYSLGQKLEHSIILTIELLLAVGQLTKHERLLVLKKIRIKIDLMRVFFRMSYEIKAINNKTYLHFQETLDEIGRMIGGWIKYTDAKS